MIPYGGIGDYQGGVFVDKAPIQRNGEIARSDLKTCMFYCQKGHGGD